MPDQPSQFPMLASLVEAERPAPSLIAVSSAMRFDGKTDVACGLARALAESGYQTLALDLDLAQAALGDRLGVTVSSTDPIRVAPNLDALALTDARAATSTKRLKAILDGVRSAYDYVIVDAPVVASGMTLLRLADAALIAVRLGRAASVADDETVETLDRLGVPVLGIVATHARPAPAPRKLTAAQPATVPFEPRTRRAIGA